MILKATYQPFEILIDDEDYFLIKNCPINIHKCKHTHYAVCRVTPTSQAYQIHRIIMGFPPHGIIHHINGNGLDNRRINLMAMKQKDHLQLHRELRKVKNENK